MSKRTADDATDANPGSSKRPKLPLIDLGRLAALSDYRKNLINALYSIFGTNKSEERNWLLLSFVTTRLIQFGLWASAEADAEKAREMKDVFIQYLVLPPAPAGQEPTCWLRDRDEALIKRVEEVKDELANCRFKLHEVAGKLENATKLVASLRAQNTGLEMDLMKSNEAMSMAKREAQKHSEALKQSLEKINQLGTAFTGAEAKRKAAEAALEKTRLDWEADSKKDRDILWDKLNEKDLLAAQLAAEEAKRTAAEEALKKLQGEFEKAQDALRQAQLYRERVEEDLANATVAAQKLKDEIAQFKENADDLTAENKSLGGTLEREIEYGKRVVADMAKLQQDKVEVERKLQDTTTELKAELQNRDSEFEELKARLHDTTAELHKWRAGDVLIDESNSSSSRTWWRARVAELKTEIQKLETENAELRAALNATNLIKSAGGEEMEALKARLHETEKLRVMAEEELDEECEMTRRQGHEIEELQTERAKLDKEAKSLRQELISRTEEKAALEKKLQKARAQTNAVEEVLEATQQEWEAVRVEVDGNFNGNLKEGDFVALACPDSDAGSDYWLALILSTGKKGKEIRVMYYADAGEQGYRAWHEGAKQTILATSVRARINRLPMTRVEREDLQAELHAPDE